jgi:hypothetical protein
VPFEQEIDVVQGKTVKLDAQLERVAYGYLLVSGNADEVEVEVNGDDIGIYLRKRREPLRIRVPAGRARDRGRRRREEVVREHESRSPAVRRSRSTRSSRRRRGRGGAVVTTILAAGSLAGGIVLNRYVAGLADTDSLKDPLNGVSIGLLAGAGVFTGSPSSCSPGTRATTRPRSSARRASSQGRPSCPP